MDPYNRTIQMKPIKSIAAATVIGICLSFASSAEAKPSLCWNPPVAGGQRLQVYDCDVRYRINANGHRVWDIDNYKGMKLTVVMWRDNDGSQVAELLYENGRVITTWYVDSDGDFRFTHPRTGQQVGFRP